MGFMSGYDDRIDDCGLIMEYKYVYHHKIDIGMS